MANYTYRLTGTYNSYIDLVSDRDLNNEVFEIGDVINLSGSIYNSGGNGVGTYTSLRVRYYVAQTSSVTTASIAVNVPVKKTVSFSGLSITISARMCTMNPDVGKVAGVNLYFECDSPSTSQVSDVGNKKIKINDPTVAPSYSVSVSDISDNTGYAERFGYMVQSNSGFKLNVPVSSISTGTDEHPSGHVSNATVTVTADDGTVIFNQSKYVTSSATTILIEGTNIFAKSGEYTCKLLLKGYYGKSSASSTTFSVLPYTKPAISANGSNPLAKRFRAEQDDTGGTIYTEAPDGNNVLVSFIGNVQAFNGLNTFDVSVKYGIDGADEMTDMGIVASGTDADSLVYSYQNTIDFMPVGTFSADNRYQIDVTITDYFGQSATITGYVDKAIFRFRITENGVSVGMNSTATAEEKKFESAYPAYMYGGIAGVTNYPAAGVEELTGGTWVNAANKRVPVYRQVLVYNLTATGSTQNGPTIADFDELVSIKGRFYRSADGYYHQLNFYASSNDMNYAYMRSDGVLRVRSTDKAIVTAIVEYTKK